MSSNSTRSTPSEPKTPVTVTGRPTSNRHQTPAKEWRSYKISHPAFIIILLLEIGLIAVLAVLLRLSENMSGFVAVNPQSSESTYQFSLSDSILSDTQYLKSTFWTQALLWTSLPTLIFSVFSSMWGSVLSALLDRQPFVELAKGDTRLKKSIMLDYRTYPSIYSWFIAFHNGHSLLGLGLLLSLILQFGVSPLSAKLFEPRTVSVNEIEEMSILTAYNDTAFTSKTDLKSIFDIVSSTTIYGGNPPAWTNGEYAFSAFSLATPHQSPLNITINTTAYSAYLNCAIISNPETALGNQDVLSIGGDDRGCPVQKNISIAASPSIFFQTWSTQDCSTSVGNSRLSIAIGQYDNSSAIHATNVSLISCIPTYWATNGSLTTANEAQTSYNFVTDAADSATFRPTQWITFERALHQASTFDPTATASTTDFGRLIMELNALNVSGILLDANKTVASVDTVFTAVWAVLSGTVLFQKLNEPLINNGIATSKTTRLFVTNAIAYVLFVILAIVVVTTFCFWVYAHRSSSILKEEPIGLLGYNSFALEGDLPQVIEAIRNEDDFDGRVVTQLEKKYFMDKARCDFDSSSDLTSNILIKSLNRKPTM